jgi:hypothetical protein
LGTLKQIKDMDNELTEDEFNEMMAANFALVSADYPIVSSEIDILPVPLVCQDETHQALADVEAMVEELEGELTWEQWLWEQTQDCCQEVGIIYVSQRREKEDELSVRLHAIEILLESLLQIGDRDKAQLEADFEAESIDGTVNVILTDLSPIETPSECQQSTHDAYQDVIDVCLDLNIALTYEGWLGEQLETACDDQT